MKHKKWIAAKVFNEQLLHNLEVHSLFQQWLTLDETIDHDGDAEVTEDEQKQWEIEQKLDGLGFRVVFNPALMQCQLQQLERKEER